MTRDDASPSMFSFPADDEVDDARLIADLIDAVRGRADVLRHPEVAAVLDEGFDAAQAAAVRAQRPH